MELSSPIKIKAPLWAFGQCAHQSGAMWEQKIAAAIYLYQADSDGEWGEIQFVFESKTAEIIRPADWDKTISRPFSKYTISYLLNCQNEKLPKEMVISFET